MRFLTIILTWISLEPVLPKENFNGTQSPPQARDWTSSKLHIDETFHLARKLRAVTVPPDFFQARQAIGTQILNTNHFFQAESSMGPPHSARLHAAMRSFPDSKA